MTGVKSEQGSRIGRCGWITSFRDVRQGTDTCLSDVRTSDLHPGVPRRIAGGPTPFGAIAQLGEHLLCKQGVVGSIPTGSTSRSEERRGGKECVSTGRSCGSPNH